MAERDKHTALCPWWDDMQCTCKPATRTCNRHSDCDAADAKAKAEGRNFVDHCHDDCCEDCLGY